MPNFCDLHHETIGKWIREEKPDVYSRIQEIKKLEPYRNVWHERVIREEVKQAAKDGKTKLQFPTGETAMKIEGLGQGPSRFYEIRPGSPQGIGKAIEESELAIGKEVMAPEGAYIITDVLGDGKFKAVQKDFYDQVKGGFDPYKGSKTEKEIWDSNSETFDISGKVDTSNPIYRFYEKTVRKYLQNKYGAKEITDPQGVSWLEVDIKPEHARLPIEAFGVLPFLSTDNMDKDRLK